MKVAVASCDDLALVILFELFVLLNASTGEESRKISERFQLVRLRFTECYRPLLRAGCTFGGLSS